MKVLKKLRFLIHPYYLLNMPDTFSNYHIWLEIQFFFLFCLNFLGVVHLASTESTGGSTTGDDEESSDAAQGQGGAAVDKVLLETRRNTYQNESIANSYRQVSS